MKSGQSTLIEKALSPLKNSYQSYRRWQKSRGREAKAVKNLKKMLGFYSSFVKRGDLCFDVGANMGNRTEVFLELGAAVVAVEPQETCLRVLEERFGANPRFILEGVALDKSRGRQELLVSSAHTLSSLSPEWVRYVQQADLFTGHDWSSTVEVNTTTLDELIEAHGLPAMCKIDVEGFEYNVLQGLSQPIKTISFEFTGGLIGPARDCVKYLNAMGDCRFNCCIGETMSFALADWVGSDEIVEVISTVPDMTGGDIYIRFSDDSVRS